MHLISKVALVILVTCMLLEISRLLQVHHWYFMVNYLKNKCFFYITLFSIYCLGFIGYYRFGSNFFIVMKNRKIAVCFLWLLLPGDNRVTDEALLAETT